MKMIKLIGLSGMLLTSTVTFAEMPIENGNISFLQVHQNPDSNTPEGQRFIVRLDSSITGGNNCGNDQWTGYLNTDAGKAQYSTLLSLYMTGKPVQLQGTSPDHCISGSVLVRNVYPKW